VCSKEHAIQACVFYRTHTLLSIHLDILNPHKVYAYLFFALGPIQNSYGARGIATICARISKSKQFSGSGLERIGGFTIGSDPNEQSCCHGTA
jgi:hypothetical protein